MGFAMDNRVLLDLLWPVRRILKFDHELRPDIPFPLRHNAYILSYLTGKVCILAINQLQARTVCALDSCGIYRRRRT